MGDGGRNSLKRQNFMHATWPPSSPNGSSRKRRTSSATTISSRTGNKNGGRSQSPAERVTLYGLTLLPRRPVSYGRIAPEEAREIFIRSALVAQECDLKADFFVHNKKLIKEITELEHKSRKQDVLVDDEALFAFL